MGIRIETSQRYRTAQHCTELAQPFIIVHGVVQEMYIARVYVLILIND